MKKVLVIGGLLYVLAAQQSLAIPTGLWSGVGASPTGNRCDFKLAIFEGAYSMSIEGLTAICSDGQGGSYGITDWWELEFDLNSGKILYDDKEVGTFSKTEFQLDVTYKTVDEEGEPGWIRFRMKGSERVEGVLSFSLLFGTHDGFVVEGGGDLS